MFGSSAYPIEYQNARAFGWGWCKTAMLTIFMGTAEFAVPSLRALLESGHTVAGVWTRPDKPHGRGHKIDVSPVKALALDAGLPIFQPPTLRRPEAATEVAAIHPDAICVAAYGLILPPAVLTCARWGCVNVHGSLLPKYRGAAPIHRAIMAGETLTGVTTMMMDEGLDTGDMLLRAETTIGPDETYGEAHDRLAQIGAGLLINTLREMEKGTCPREPQDSSESSYAPPVRKEECQIDWTRSAREIHDLVRGANPRPGAYTFRAGDLLRIHRAPVTDAPLPGPPGALHVLPGTRAPAVVCGEGAVELKEVQPAGKKAMRGVDYLLGRPVREGAILGSAG